MTLLCLSAELVFGQVSNPTVENAYFPFDLYKRENRFGEIEVDSARLGYHSFMLRRFEEPKLFNSTDSNVVYRFTWLRSFDPPMTISLSVRDNKVILQTKIGNKSRIDNSHFDLTKLDRKENERFDEYTKGNLDSLAIADLFEKGIYVKDTVKFRYTTLTRELTTEEYEKFKNLVDKKQFWTYPAISNTGSGVDGADWILEGLRKENEYHIVYRWSPGKYRDLDFRILCEYLISLTGTTRKGRVY